MRCFSALKLTLKQKCISDFFVLNAGTVLSDLKQNLLWLELEPLMKPICEGEMAILRLEHLVVKIIAI